ncbi:MAG: transporter permease [Herminiimonas sp.]|nr:transporter permease [Herminiimonas sp.]
MNIQTIDASRSGARARNAAGSNWRTLWFALSLIAFIAAPFVVANYWLYWICLIAINIVSATGLNILSGYTGLSSLGQAAFMGVGAYTVALLELRAGTPFLINLPVAGIVAALIGLIVGIPSLRVRGLYLAIATIAASIILDFIFANWTSVTNGVKGLTVPPAQAFGIVLDQPFKLYWLIMPIAALLVWMASNLFKTRVGRAFIAIRDRDISAEVLGIPLLRYKLMSFGLSSFYAGIAGGLWAYFFRVVTPESFPIVMSIFFLAAIIVGGMGTIMGSILGAIFMTLVPELLRFGFTLLTPWMPDAMSIIPAVRSIVFGVLIVGFLLFEPQGLVEVLPRLRRRFRLRSPKS